MIMDVNDENYLAYKKLRERYLELYYTERHPISKDLLYQQYKMFAAKEQQYIDMMHKNNK